MIERLRQLFGRREAAQAERAALAPDLDPLAPDTIARFADMARTSLAAQDACALRTGGVMLLNPGDVRDAFSQKGYSNEPSRFSALAPRNSEKYVAAQVAANIPPFLDAPRHTVVRKWLSKSVLTTLASFRDQLEDKAERYVAGLPSGQDMLLIEDVARAFVTQTICEFTGVSLPEGELKRYTVALFKLFAPVHDAETFERTNQALADARTALLAQVPDAQARPEGSVLKAMAAWDHLLDPLDLSDQEKQLMFADNILLILADGVENVEAAIGNVMMAWCDHAPDQRPDIDEPFVRSCIHAATPGQTIARIATQEMHIGGLKCPAGAPVFLSLAGANARSDEGDDFSFGLGRHRCIGEGLAIAMIETCSRHLARRAPTLDLRDQSYEAVFGHRWVRGVKVRLS